MSGKGNLTPPEIFGNHPAYPCVIEQHNRITNESNVMQFGGLSQRQVVAMSVLAGMMSHPGASSAKPASEVGAAFAYADLFLKFEYDEAMAKLPDDAPDPNKPSPLIIVPGGKGAA